MKGGIPVVYVAELDTLISSEFSWGLTSMNTNESTISCSYPPPLLNDLFHNLKPPKNALYYKRSSHSTLDFFAQLETQSKSMYNIK